MWTVENRARYDRSKLRYPSDVTDAEWSLVKTEVPRAKRGGNRRTVDVREVMTGDHLCIVANFYDIAVTQTASG